MENKKKLVTIIIPTYNREHTICQAIDSVLQQTYDQIEVIVVDDCSQDATQKVVEENYGTDSRVRYERLLQNSGACAARNRGIDLSQGDYLAFLDSDDVYYPEKISLQLEAMQNSASDLCATSFTRVLADGKKERKLVFPGTKDEIYQNLLYCNFITTGALIGKRECFEKIQFDESLPRYQDWDIVLRLCKQYSICLLNVDTLKQIHQEVSITSSTGHHKTLYALERLYEKHQAAYKANTKANTQINWLMGIHSMYGGTKRQYSRLWLGVVGEGFNLKRFLIFLVMCLRLEKVFSSSL